MRRAKYLPAIASIRGILFQKSSSILIKRSNIRPHPDLPLGRRLPLHVNRLLAAIVLHIVRATALAALDARRPAVLLMITDVVAAGVDVDLAPAAALVHHVELCELVGAQAAARTGGVAGAAAELVVRPAAVRAAQQGRGVALGERLEGGD